MSEEESKTTKAITTAQLAMSGLNLVKTVGLAVLVLMVDYFRRQQAKAEKELAVLQTDLTIQKKKQEIPHAQNVEQANSIVSDFLKSDDDTAG
jgi:hypothetical protein